MEEKTYGQGQRIWSCGVVHEICFSGMQRTDKNRARRLGRVDVTLTCKMVSLDLILLVMRVWRGACVCMSVYDVCLCTCACGGQKLASSVILYCFPLNLKVINSARLVGK